MKLRVLFRTLTILVVFALVVAGISLAQETTGALQGTVKDSSGAVVPGATVEATAPDLVGKKTTTTDSSGYYRFSNLPPGNYTLTVSATKFKTVKREGLTIEIGHFPTVDITLPVGGSSEVLDVTGAAPMIDTTTETTQTNITNDVIQNVPHATRSFQSVIQFAPSASNEPLMGSNRMSNGSGGVSPGNGSNGNPYGYSVAGGSDSENSYLVEGQATSNIIGGYSHTNVPFDFIQEVQVKSSGIDAQYGGALGGVVNVVMKKGTNSYHGSLFTQFENQGMDASPTQIVRYDPLSGIIPGTYVDATSQWTQPVKPHTSDVYPGFTIGGPILKDKLFFFLGFNPEFNDYEEHVFEGPSLQVPFSRNTQTYYTNARIDYAVTQKVRVFASWLYQYQRQSGQNLPSADTTQNYYNVATNCFGSASSSDPTSPNYCAPFSGVPISAYAHNIGYSAPNQTINTGADWTITQHLVSTTRFGYYFENYHDFGYPTTGNLYVWGSSGISTAANPVSDNLGNPLPASLQQANGYFNVANSANTTSVNANKAIQFDQNFALYKSGWGGTHNFNFGFQLNRLSNYIIQHYNEPLTNVYVGSAAGNGIYYQPGTTQGTNFCAAYDGTVPWDACAGQYGYITIQDFGTHGQATSYNYGFFGQDAWTLSHGLTINAGLRIEHEYLPGEGGANGTALASNPKPIDFGWGQKIAPRIGAAWDVFKDGRLKLFGSYGKFYDIMKLNVAISSFGGQYWNNCAYLLNTPDISSITPAFNSAARYCEGDPTAGANFGTAGQPAGLTFIENQNFRAWPTSCSTCSAEQEGVAPNLHPYAQHETVFGSDYQLKRNLALEVRWDRRRLDNAIEDSSIFNPLSGGETFVIVNPGKGVDNSFNNFCNFLYPGQPVCTPTTGTVPQGIIPAARSYDGVEFRLMKATSHNWYAMVSYTWSYFRGNYTGLTSSDISDGGLGGRNSPNNSRSFDEPYFSYNSFGSSSSGLLPTDRPNKFKGYAYYNLKEGQHFSTDIGLFQYFYEGTPTTSFVDVGYGYAGQPGFPVDIANRGEFVNITQDPTTGAITVGAPYVNRTPWYIQSDFSVTQNWKVTESKSLAFTANFTNLFNQHAIVAKWGGANTLNQPEFLTPGGQYVFNGADFYQAVMTPYNLQYNLNNAAYNFNNNQPIINNDQYNKGMFWQLPRNIRLGLKFTF
jgi:outer membrane receptor protein involved in Fe transport